MKNKRTVRMMTAAAVLVLTVSAPLCTYAAVGPFSCGTGNQVLSGTGGCPDIQSLLTLVESAGCRGGLDNFSCQNSSGNYGCQNNLGSFSCPNVSGNYGCQNNLGSFSCPNVSGNYGCQNSLGNLGCQSASGNTLCPTYPSESLTPDIQVPDFQIPDFQIPDVQVPDFQIPDFQIPDFQIPDFQIPDVQVPDFQFPDIQMPDIQVPDFQFPDVQTPAPQNPGSQDSYADQVVSLVNSRRAAAGLAPLSVNYEVAAAAMTRAHETERYFDHTRPDGRGFYTALTDAGIAYSSAGENIAYGQRSAEEVMNAWMNSPGHRANILNSGYTQIGVAHYKNSSGTDYWVQLFIR